MNRLILALAAVGFAAFLIIGLMASDALRPSPEIAAAQARREQAIALQAEAAAAEAWTAAAAKEAARPATEAKLRMIEFSIGGSIAILTIGASMAMVIFLNVRASTIYPNADGHYPIIVDRRKGRLLTVDTSRGLGPVMIEGQDGTFTFPLPGSEASQLQIATNAQAAAVMIGVARKAEGEAVLERVARASANLPAPRFAEPSSDSLKLVYVNDPNRAKRERAEAELSELREFIERGWLAGLSRERWMGSTFGCTGRRCSRSYWERIIERLSKANLVEQDAQGAWVPSVTREAALESFGLTGAGGGGREARSDHIE